MRKLVHKACQILERKTRSRGNVAQPAMAAPLKAEPAPADGQVDAVQSLLHVDAYRRRLAGTSPDLQEVLGGIEMTLARQLGREFNRYQG